MCEQTFENITEKIATGTADVCDIREVDSCKLNAEEKQALLNSLAERLVKDKTALKQVVELKGSKTGGILNVPPFLNGYIKFIDIDSSQEIGLGGSTQYTIDNDQDQHVENFGDLRWSFIEGKFYNGRLFNIPNGVKAIYLFILK